jgi:hypothetical protein
MKLRHPILCTSLLFTAFLACAPFAQAAQAGKQDAKIDAGFAEGTKALNEQRWNDALTFFDKASRDENGRTDAALYWKAYTLSKLNRTQEVLETCNTLRTRFPDSSWNKDCISLLINTKEMANQLAQTKIAIALSRADAVNASRFYFPNDLQLTFGPGGGGDPESEIKILALNSLMKQNPTQAMPMLRNILSGDSSIQMKSHALFILAQDKSPEAKALLEDVAKGKMGPELQREAVRFLVISQGAKANDTLLDIYKTTTDPKVKQSVISAVASSHDASRLVDMARNEKDLKLKRDIVSYLAPMHDKVAQDYMLELLK